ncbi:MAG: hypothetical protein ACE37H_12855 [Phycisphaeraceae bacterium]
MRHDNRPIRCVLAFALLAVCVGPVRAQAWQTEDGRLSMQPPAEWDAFEPSLLEAANKQVRHVTGRSFIAGYARGTSAGTTLIFPYLLVQYEPYADLPEADRPASKPDLPGKLELLTRIVDAMKPADDLPDAIDLETFAQQFGSELVRPLAMTDDGRFDLAGDIPTQDGSEPIRYHTHGVMGKDGVAMVTVFGGERFDQLDPVIQGPLRTLAFAEGHAYADLPDAPPPGDGPDAESSDGGTPGTEPAEPDAQAPAGPGDSTDADAQDADGSSQGGDKTGAGAVTTNGGHGADAPAERSIGALILILAVMGVVMFAVVGIVVFVTHQKAQARRERARARRERLEQSAS